MYPGTNLPLLLFSAGVRIAIGAYKHNGFWKCMDTLRDKNLLNELWDNDDADWKIW